MISNLSFLILVQPIVLILNIMLNLVLILGMPRHSTKWISSDKTKKRKKWFLGVKLMYLLFSPFMFIVYFEVLILKFLDSLFLFKKKKTKLKGKVNPFIYEMH